MKLSKNRRAVDVLLSVLIAFLFAALYLATPTCNFSYDALTYALDVQFGTFAALFHPNHLLFNVIGRFIFLALATLNHAVGALWLLQKLNAIIGGIAVGVLAWILARRFGWVRGVLGAAAMGLGIGFWTEAVDAGCYMWAALAACGFLAALLAADDASPFWLGAFHGLCVLFHELLILAVPGALVKVGRKKSGLYLAGVATVVVGGYAGVALLLYGSSYHEAMRWLWGPARQPHGTAINFFYWFTFDFARGVAGLWTGLVHSFAAPVSSAHPLDTMVENGVVLAILLAVLIQSRRDFKGRSIEGNTRAALWVWIGAMNLFLLFYIPGVTRFRLLFLPALLYLVCDTITLSPKGVRAALAGVLLIVMAWVNYRAVIYPQSQLRNNPSLVRVLWLNQVLKPGDTFLFSGGLPDSIINVYVAYFASSLNGRSLRGYFFENPRGNLVELKEMIQQARAAHRPVFIEKTLFDPENQLALDRVGDVPSGTVRRWFSTFKPVRQVAGPDGYAVVETR
jgi:hypothetical protein